jgi:transcriptional regulator with XRE-family HTH domain
MLSTPIWDATARARLSRHRKDRGHTQADLAKYVAVHGGPAVTQSTVSGWETGRIVRPPSAALPVLLKYVVEGAEDLALDVRPLSRRELSQFEELANRLAADESDAAVTPPPPPGTEDGRLYVVALLEALLERLRTNGEFGPQEHELVRWALAHLGLPPVSAWAEADAR